MNIIAIDIQDEDAVQLLSQAGRNSYDLPKKVQENKHIQVTFDKGKEIEESISQRSSHHEDYLPESQSSENTMKYKRYSLRIRDIQIICQDQFYKKGEYSGIHRLKTDAQHRYGQKKEEKLRNSPNGIKSFKSKKEESLHPKMKGRKLETNYSLNRQKFIFKSDRILASSLYSSKKLQGK